MLACGLLVLPPNVRPAQAIDLSPTGTNARLVFSPTTLFSPPTQLSICALNLSNVTVEVNTVMRSLQGDFPDQVLGGAVAPGKSFCNLLTSIYLNIPDPTAPMYAWIELRSPAVCSHATEYPGKCMVLGSFEATTLGDNVITSQIHVEPVLVPGSPGNPKVTNFPQ
jgi:hypothetical protein